MKDIKTRAQNFSLGVMLIFASICGIFKPDLMPYALMGIGCGIIFTSILLPE